jgi:hypothetical protein
MVPSILKTLVLAASLLLVQAAPAAEVASVDASVARILPGRCANVEKRQDW